MQSRRGQAWKWGVLAWSLGALLADLVADELTHTMHGKCEGSGGVSGSVRLKLSEVKGRGDEALI